MLRGSVLVARRTCCPRRPRTRLTPRARSLRTAGQKACRVLGRSGGAEDTPEVRSCRGIAMPSLSVTWGEAERDTGYFRVQCRGAGLLESKHQARAPTQLF